MPAEWRTEFGGEMVLARFLWEAEKKAAREKAPRTGNERGKAFRNREEKFSQTTKILLTAFWWDTMDPRLQRLLRTSSTNQRFLFYNYNETDAMESKLVYNHKRKENMVEIIYGSEKNLF